MKEFINRIPAQGKTNRKKITYSDSTEEYVFIENADDPTVSGTPINRATMLAIQGFAPTTVARNSNNQIVETNTDTGETLTTTITSDGSTITVVQVFVGTETITKTSVYSDGSVTEVIS